jgi:translation initiation factor IF-2
MFRFKFMNVTELARILKISPQELLDKLPQLGFHIGQRAIKVDNKTAQRIIREWPNLIRQLEEKEKKEKEKLAAETGEGEKKPKKEVKIPNFITVRDFAILADVPISRLLSELMKNGIFTSMNEKIDFETAAIVGADLGLDIKLAEQTEDGGGQDEKNKLKEILGKEKTEKLLPRPPVIVVMGHVDHGKTKLLDAIRKTNVVAGEAGGITQHIGAYQVKRKDKTITFIDTPGHEAFTAMRSRGAKVADIAILVVAADDGVKPQTVEACNIIKAAGVPFVVAINKIDKEGVDINKTKQELSTQLNITPEDWGGKTVCALVSAKTEQGIEDLLDVLLLTADMEAENIKANPDADAVGTVIESRVSKGEGPVATLLVQNGTLRIGNQLCFNNQVYGKVRGLKNYKGETISEAPPATPVKIIGLKIAPQVGDILEVGEGEKIKIKKMKGIGDRTTSIKQVEEKDENKIKKINLIIKSDVFGSAEAIEESLEKINTENVKVKIVQKGLGNITEGNVISAEQSGAQIIGFNVKVPPPVEELARSKNIKIKTYNIIYDLIDDIKEQMQALLDIELRRVDLGKLKVIAVFRTENKSQIIGGRVVEGKIGADNFIEVSRDGETIAQGKLTKLQAGKQDVNSVETNQECGIQYEGKPVIQVGDILNFYKKEKIIKKI